MLIQPTSWTLLSLTSLADFHAENVFLMHKKNNKKKTTNIIPALCLMLQHTYYAQSYAGVLCKVLAIAAGRGYKGYHLVHKVGLKGPGSERPGGCSCHVMPVGIDTITTGHGSLLPIGANIVGISQCMLEKL